MASHRPLITSFSPAAAAVGDYIRITGFDLRRTTGVTIGGTSAGSVKVIGGAVRCRIAGGTTTGRVVVTTDAGAATSDTELTIVTSAPTVTRIAPESGSAGDEVTITGSHFSGVTGVKIGGVTAPFTVDSDTLITVTVPGGAVTGLIALTGPAGPGASGTFTYVPTPSVHSFTPTGARAGDTITIRGSGFSGASAVTVGGTAVASFTVHTDVRITAVLGSGTTGQVAVTNTNGTGTSTDSLTLLPAPTIRSFTPTSAAAEETVKITGTNLDGVTDVTFAGAAGTVLSSTPTTATVEVPHGAAIGPIAVTTLAGTATSRGNFIPAAAPEIDYVEPLFAQIGDGITVAGIGLTGATDVTVGGVACTSVVVGSDTSLTAVIGVASPTGTVTVTTPDGAATSEQSIAIQAAPTVSARTPSSGSVGDVVTLTGTGFDGITDVSFFSSKPAAFAVLSPTKIRTTVPSAATTGVITVTNAVGSGASGSFTVV